MGTAEPAATAESKAIRHRGASREESKAARGFLPTRDERYGLKGLLNHDEYSKLAASFEAAGSVPELAVIGDLMADMGLEAWNHAARGSWRRGLWGVTWKAAGSLSAVVTAALGGSILAFNSLSSTGRYALAAIAFLAAAMGALQPGEELSADRRRHNSYASLHRRILHYVMTLLPAASPLEARVQLAVFNTEFDHILGDVIEPLRSRDESTASAVP